MNAVCLAMHYDFSAQGRTGNLIVVDTFKMGCHEGSPGRIVHCLQDIGNVHDDINQQHETRKFMDEFGTKLMAWTPLAEGQNGMFTNPHPDWREIWQDCRSSNVALAAAERCNHHPEDCS